MGLDICTENFSERVGSYSGVHILRVNMIKASIEYLKQFKDCYFSDAMVCHLEKTLNSDDSPPLDYKHFKSFIEIADDNMVGLYKWVYHSDCEGYLTSEDSEKILETLKVIYPYLDSRYFINDENKFEEFYLYNIFNDSVETGCDVVFG
jgi:hypothetical protein